jgi:RHS repeat-associated protein
MDEAISITYDLNGNMQTKGKQTFSYDIENRLTELEGPAKQSSPRTFDLTLSPGWNFFSLPVIPAQAGIQEVFSSLSFNTDYDQISRYDPDKKDFAHYNNTEYNQFEDLEYGKGYLVYVPDSEGCTLSLQGSAAAETISNELLSGWNLIGVPHIQETSVAEALNNLEEGVDYDRIVRYNKETKLFENLSTSDLLNPGEAYYLHCLKNTTWNIQPNEKQITEFAYDGDGGRVRKSLSLRGGEADEAISTTTYIGSLYEVNSDGTTRNHIFAGSNRIATISSSQGDEAISYYHQDHLGSSSVITDQDGQLVQHLEYLPFGKTQVSTGTDTVSHKFTGKELDASTGLYYYGARYYDPEIGRFITPDTIVQAPYNPQTLNRYSYCNNNPINYVDPTGHGWWKKFWRKVSGFVAAAVGTIVGIVTANPILGIAAYSAISASGQSGSFGKNFGINFASGMVGWGIGAGIAAKFAGGFLAGLAGSALGGAGAGAVTSAMLGGDVGRGALAGLAGGAIGYVGGRVWPLGADAVAGGVSSVIMGGKFGEGAIEGAYNNAARTVGGILAPMSRFSPENTQAGDIAYFKANSPQGLAIALLEGGPFSHVGTITEGGETGQLASTTFGGDSGYKRSSDYKGRGSYVSTRYRGNQSVINAAKALANTTPKIKYGFFPGQKVCSTITAAGLNKAGYAGWYGIGPNSQLNIIRMYGED